MTVAEPLAAVASEAEPLHRRLGVTDDELDAIRSRLRREPNDLELAIFSVMWSEHCSYKSSRPLLSTLPTRGEGVVAGPGENAGVISIGDGLAVAFKIESHNRPASAASCATSSRWARGPSPSSMHCASATPVRPGRATSSTA